MAGEFRLLSDRVFARGNETACTWQENARTYKETFCPFPVLTRNLVSQATMASNFQQTFTKLSLLGHSQANLLDCSEVIGTAPPATQKQAFFPPGKTHNDIEQGVCLFHFSMLHLSDPFPSAPLSSSRLRSPLRPANPLRSRWCESTHPDICNLSPDAIPQQARPRYRLRQEEEVDTDGQSQLNGYRGPVLISFGVALCCSWPSLYKYSISVTNLHASFLM